jgi:hypothetical protein
VDLVIMFQRAQILLHGPAKGRKASAKSLKTTIEWIVDSGLHNIAKAISAPVANGAESEETLIA